MSSIFEGIFDEEDYTKGSSGDEPLQLQSASNSKGTVVSRGIVEKVMGAIDEKFKSTDDRMTMLEKSVAELANAKERAYTTSNGTQEGQAPDGEYEYRANVNSTDGKKIPENVLQAFREYLVDNHPGVTIGATRSKISRNHESGSMVVVRFWHAEADFLKHLVGKKGAEVLTLQDELAKLTTSGQRVTITYDGGKKDGTHRRKKGSRSVDASTRAPRSAESAAQEMLRKVTNAARTNSR